MFACFVIQRPQIFFAGSLALRLSCYRTWGFCHLPKHLIKNLIRAPRLRCGKRETALLIARQFS
jgi:hypothetical protein